MWDRLAGVPQTRDRNKVVEKEGQNLYLYVRTCAIQIVRAGAAEGRFICLWLHTQMRFEAETRSHWHIWETRKRNAGPVHFMFIMFVGTTRTSETLPTPAGTT